jgi:hypothetical protein
MNKATGTATVQLDALVRKQAGLSAMAWIWLSFGALALVLVIAMGGYAVRHRRRGQAPA